MVNTPGRVEIKRIMSLEQWKEKEDHSQISPGLFEQNLRNPTPRQIRIYIQKYKKNNSGNKTRATLNNQGIMV